MFAACGEQTETYTPQQPGQKVPITIGWTEVELSTRAPIEGIQLPDGSVFGISMFTEDCTNIPVEVQGKQYNLLKPAYVIGDKEQPLYAYYPMGEMKEGNLKLSFVDDENSEYPDYLYCTTSINAFHPSAKISFRHILSRVTLVIGPSEDYIKPCQIKDITLQGMAADGLNIRTGELLGLKPYTYKSKAEQKLNDNPVLQVEWLVAPCQFGENEHYITCTVDGEKRKAFLPASQWKAGTHYIYPVEVGLNQSIIKEDIN